MYTIETTIVFDSNSVLYRSKYYYNQVNSNFINRSKLEIDKVGGRHVYRRRMVTFYRKYC